MQIFRLDNQFVLFFPFQCDLSKKNEELEALKQQHDLLQKMLHQQEELRALQGRQTALLALQREAEERLKNSTNNALPHSEGLQDTTDSVITARSSGMKTRLPTVLMSTLCHLFMCFVLYIQMCRLS